MIIISKEDVIKILILSDYAIFIPRRTNGSLQMLHTGPLKPGT